ncbi:MAG TPA: DCC1-like thiol-disulfide oxidoreductase family protein [Thermoanaerobaculia bacterium]|nr:DCC1-like thiol-disulfide oxidoreductase family protein [Thermoanaerobaculia bacterium]
MTSGAVLVFDGDCGVCDAGVQRILRHERRHSLTFAAHGSRFAENLLARHPSLNGVDSMIWVEPGTDGERVLVRSEAVLRAADYIGGGWRLAGVLRLIPRGLRDRAYDLLARNRHRLSRPPGVCRVPDSAVRERFLA